MEERNREMEERDGSKEEIRRQVDKGRGKSKIEGDFRERKKIS